MNRTILMLAMLIILAAFIQAASCPTNPPVTYTGTATENGVPIDGETIIAKIGTGGTATTNQGDVDDGVYSVLVSPCYGTTSGTITFSINGVPADLGAQYGGQADWGKLIVLNLKFGDFPQNPPCPNGIINVGEVCDGSNLGGATCSSVMGESFLGSLTCQNDCLDFVTTNCYQTCIEDWECTEWSACTSGTQTRTCTEQNGCGTADDKPAESQSCSGSGSSSSSSSGGGSSSSSSGGGSSSSSSGGGSSSSSSGGGSSSSSSGGSTTRTTTVTEEDTETVNPAAERERQRILEGSNQDSYEKNTDVEVFSAAGSNTDNTEASQNALTGAAIGASGKTTAIYALLILGVVALLVVSIVYVKRVYTQKKNKKMAKTLNYIKKHN